jgi:hypothetical protein
MQVISGYLDVTTRSTMLEFRLYHLNRPAVKAWRKKCYQLDDADNLVIRLAKNQQVVAIDCAGWYLDQFGMNVQCVESSDISKLYFSNCAVEPDLMTHRPTYIHDAIVLFKFPYFLRYCTVAELVDFLELWCKDIMVLNFNPTFIKHNRLKYKAVDLVKKSTNLRITEVNKNLWLIKK